MPIQPFDDNYFMKKALQEADFALESGEIPVGAVVVCNGKVVAKASNQVEQLQDSTAHAEILALTAAFNYLGAKYLPDCTLYVTLEPCVMCAGALFWSQIGKVVYGAPDPHRGYGRVEEKLLHPKTKVKGGVMAEECQAPLDEFFRRIRGK